MNVFTVKFDADSKTYTVANKIVVDGDLVIPEGDMPAGADIGHTSKDGKKWTAPPAPKAE